MTHKIRKAVFTVGGMGTRFLPATKAIPKEMLPVVDKPLIQYAVEEAQAAGIEEFIFVTGRGKYAIEDHFDQSYELEKSLAERGKTDALALLEGIRLPAGRVAYTRQQEPLGLGHAVWCARQLVGEEPFALLLADDLIMSQRPCLAQMVEVYEQQAKAARPAHVVATMQVEREKVSRYGVLEVESEAGALIKARGLVEKPAPEAAPSTHAIVGRYILQPQVFAPLEARQKGAGGEIQLTDAIAATLPEVDFYGYQFEGQRFDCGSKIGFFEAQLAYTLQRPDMAERARKVLGKYI
jgi:UTP--glucose-1-phosphate uridylyltransferase